MGSHLDADPTQAVDGLVRAIRDLTSDPNYKLVADVFSEFLYVKEQNNKLSSSHQVVLEEYRKFRNELEAQKEELLKEKQELEGLVQEKVQEILQMQAARARLESDLEDTQKLIERERSAAAQAVENIKKEYAELQAAKTLVEQEKKLGEELAAAAAAKAAEEIAALTQANNKLMEIQASHDSVVKSLKGHIADLQSAKKTLEQIKADNELEIARLAESKLNLEKIKARNDVEIEGLKAKVSDLYTSKTSLEQIKMDNEAKIATLKERVESLEQVKKNLERELEAAQKEIASLKDTIAHKNNEIESLQESLRAAEEQITSLQQTVDEKNAEIEDLHAKLKAEGERANKAEEHGRDLQIQLEETTQNLQTTSEKLRELEQYRILLQDEPDDTYVTILDKIWTTIVTLVESTFRPDIDEAILADPSCWTNLRNSPYLKHATQLQIPLPQSNSPAAKGMRISAVLSVLSRAMHKHLFRPVYLLDDDDENLVRFLRALEDEDPEREAHIRATLLAAMPERQLEQGARRVKTVVREVSWLVQHLLSALQFEAFCAGLEAACKLACEQWMRIQVANMKIEPYFGPPYDDFDWQVLELPEFAEAADRDPGMPHTRADTDEAAIDDRLDEADRAASAATGSQLFNDSAIEPQEEMLDGEIDPDEILLVVWPSMCAVENGELMSITQGLVISKEQARPALEEQRARSRMISRPGSRRARTMSMPGHSRASSPRGRPYAGGTHPSSEAVTVDDR